MAAWAWVRVAWVNGQALSLFWFYAIEDSFHILHPRCNETPSADVSAEVRSARICEMGSVVEAFDDNASVSSAMTENSSRLAKRGVEFLERQQRGSSWQLPEEMSLTKASRSSSSCSTFASAQAIRPAEQPDLKVMSRSGDTSQHDLMRPPTNVTWSRVLDVSIVD